ncbi:MAG: hypothetical protein VXZ82_09375 [Planctomycetota bacterium]|nr:hypothetical protein [Planctomycetota bacterium]
MTHSSQLSRREALRRALHASLFLPAATYAARTSLSASPAGNGELLQRMVRPQNLKLLHSRAKMVTELSGKLHLEPLKESDGPFRAAEIRSKSTLDYFEKLTFEGSQFNASARRYVEANSENWVAGKTSQRQLRPECKNTKLMWHEGSWEQFCTEEPLDQRETELLQSSVNSGSLELLLPEGVVSERASWRFENDEVQHLFNLEAVHKNTLNAKISKIEDGVLSVELSGAIEASANSVATHLDVRGNFRAEVASQSAIITWLALAIQERREISESQPGFEIEALVRMIRIETGDNKVDTSEKVLRELATENDPGRWLVRIQSTPGGFSMLADRRWKMFVDSREETILRLVENNNVIAQCNISRLTNMKPGTHVTTEGIQSDLKRQLGSKFRNFLESDERVTSNELRLVRIAAAGQVQDVPIQWIYDHLSNDAGDRMALMFTVGGNMGESFAAGDLQLASSFEMWQPPVSIRAPTEKNAALSTETLR